MAKNINSPKDSLKKLSRRNPMHNHPLLSKGGIHRKTNKSKRRLEKVKIKQEWLPQNVLLAVCFGEIILHKNGNYSN